MADKKIEIRPKGSNNYGDRLLPVTNAAYVEGLTKSFIGLGSVQNYGIATQAQAEAGTATSVYMNPLRTKQAIDAFAISSSYISGNAEYTDSISAGATITKDISIGAGKIAGKAVFTPRESVVWRRGRNAGVLVFFTRVNLDGFAVGNTWANTNDIGGSAVSVRYLGSVTSCQGYSGGSEYYVFGARVLNMFGNSGWKLRISSCYINGNNLRIQFISHDTEARNLDVRVDWEVW